MAINNQENHLCEKVPEIITLQKDVENIKVNVCEVTNKQNRLEETIVDIRDFISEQKKTNEYLEKVVSQNATFLEKIDSKYEVEINENRNKLHELEMTMLSENTRQDNNYNKEKSILILKVLGWTLGAIGFLGMALWNIILPALGLK